MSRAALAAISDLTERGEPFVLATVVWSLGPSSGKAGAKAVITADGKIRGWLGGACAEPTVIGEALRALQEGTPRLLALGPAVAGREGVVSVPMACESEGSMEVYLEPSIPQPNLIAVGRSPAVVMLARLAIQLGWPAAIIDDGGSAADHEGIETHTTLSFEGLHVDGRTFIVVATQGHYDEPALQAALATEAGYVGLVASRKRADAVLEFLRGSGVMDEDLARIRAPAGLDLGHVAHEEIAVGVLAELVALRGAGGMTAAVTIRPADEAIDPVCSMTVNIASSYYSAEHAGRTYYFCAAGCQRRFEEDLSRYEETA